MKIAPGGDTYFVCAINSFVHVIMWVLPDWDIWQCPYCIHSSNAVLPCEIFNGQAFKPIKSYYKSGIFLLELCHHLEMLPLTMNPIMRYFWSTKSGLQVLILPDIKLQAIPHPCRHKEECHKPSALPICYCVSTGTCFLVVSESLYSCLQIFRQTPPDLLIADLSMSFVQSKGIYLFGPWICRICANISRRDAVILFTICRCLMGSS